MNSIDPRCTEDALEYGKRATPEHLDDLILDRINTVCRAEKLQKMGNLQKALDEAFKAQLLREAIESYRKNH